MEGQRRELLLIFVSEQDNDNSNVTADDVNFFAPVA